MSRRKRPDKRKIYGDPKFNSTLITQFMNVVVSRGKRSIVLNLKDEKAKEVFRELAKEADCVVEAMRPGALARMGLGRRVRET